MSTMNPERCGALAVDVTTAARLLGFCEAVIREMMTDGRLTPVWSTVDRIIVLPDERPKCRGTVRVSLYSIYRLIGVPVEEASQLMLTTTDSEIIPPAPPPRYNQYAKQQTRAGRGGAGGRQSSKQTAGRRGRVAFYVDQQERELSERLERGFERAGAK